MSSAQGQRIQATCKTIWGSYYEYNLDIETDDYVNYMCIVKRDFGTSYGPPLTITSLCGSDKAAWAELDRMLELWARQVKRGTPMTRDENLEIFGGSKGEHKKVLSKFMDEFERRKGAKSA